MTKEAEELYRSGVTQVLAGFQLLEENLKTYLGMHFDSVRLLLGDKLHFDFKREDYQDAALGRLVTVFAKVCPNKELVSDLSAIVKTRNHIAHQALLRLHHGQPISPEEYPPLLSDVHKTMDSIWSLGTRIVEEMKNVISGLSRA